MAVGEETIRAIEAKAEHFHGVKSRQNIDVLLRTAQQHHVSLSVMADTKASILITVSSIVMTIALSRMGEPAIRSALLTLAAACLVSLVLAIVAVLPQFGKRAGSRNLLFFGHFAEMTEDEYMKAIEGILESDERVYETLVRDLYALGTYLHRKKYRFLRYAYISLLTGFIVAALVEIFVIVRLP
jgi:hypothetical protein